MEGSLFSPGRATQIQYEIDGHLYTTYIAAALAGIRAAGAAELAWGSQFPDSKRRFTGVSAAWNSLWSQHAQGMMKTLHSFHGGDAQAVRKRRDDLKALVATGIAQGEPDWKVGLIIHAFGDSYAHTYGEHGKEVAYETPGEQGPDGHTPDQIGNFPQKYLEYVGNLYEALGGRGEPHAVLARLRGIVEGSGNVSAEIAAYAVELGMSRDLCDRVRDRLLAHVSESGVTRTMEFMEAAFDAC